MECSGKPILDGGGSMNSHLWIKSFGKNRPPIGGSVVETIANGEGASLRCRRKNSREPERGDILREHPPQPPNFAGTKPFAAHVCTSHAQFVAVLAGALPRAIPLDVDAVDLEDRADH